MDVINNFKLQSRCTVSLRFYFYVFFCVKYFFGECKITRSSVGTRLRGKNGSYVSLVDKTNLNTMLILIKLDIFIFFSIFKIKYSGTKIVFFLWS